MPCTKDKFPVTLEGTSNLSNIHCTDLLALGINRRSYAMLVSTLAMSSSAPCFTIESESLGSNWLRLSLIQITLPTDEL